MIPTKHSTTILIILLFCISCSKHHDFINVYSGPNAENLRNNLIEKYEHENISVLFSENYVDIIFYFQDEHFPKELEKKAKDIALYALEVDEDLFDLGRIYIFFDKSKNINKESKHGIEYKFYISDLNLSKSLKQAQMKYNFDPDNDQLKADLGWLLFRSGSFDDAMTFLKEAPLDPTNWCNEIFPDAKSPEEKRNLYLYSIQQFSTDLDEEKLILGHIFISHLSYKKIKDDTLISELKTMADQTKSPLYYDALTSISYRMDDMSNHLIYSESVIEEIEKMKFQTKSNKHMSHFYYNAACSHSTNKDYSMAEKRLKKAFRINDDLYIESLENSNLKNLRKYLGKKQYEKMFNPKTL